LRSLPLVSGFKYLYFVIEYFVPYGIFYMEKWLLYWCTLSITMLDDVRMAIRMGTARILLQRQGFGTVHEIGKHSLTMMLRGRPEPMPMTDIARPLRPGTRMQLVELLVKIPRGTEETGRLANDYLSQQLALYDLACKQERECIYRHASTQMVAIDYHNMFGQFENSEEIPLSKLELPIRDGETGMRALYGFVERVRTAPAA
jgi:hypothetical protein